MERIFIMYKLKNGANLEEYIKYSIEKDQPTVKRQEGVSDFEVFEIKKEDKRSKEFDIIESILVDSYEKWVEITNNPEMTKNIEEWSKYGDDESVRSIICKEIK